jgi:hypothetical protein
MCKIGKIVFGRIDPRTQKYIPIPTYIACVRFERTATPRSGYERLIADSGGDCKLLTRTVGKS